MHFTSTPYTKKTHTHAHTQRRLSSPTWRPAATMAAPYIVHLLSRPPYIRYDPWSRYYDAQYIASYLLHLILKVSPYNTDIHI